MRGRKRLALFVGALAVVIVAGTAGTASASTWHHRRHHPKPHPTHSQPAPAPKPPPAPPPAPPPQNPPPPAPQPPAPPPPGGSTGTAYHVQDGKLLDPCGVEVVLRGVNKMAVFTDRSGNSFPEIAKSGANSVRFMWFTSVPAAEAQQTLQRAVDSHLIPIWELHDATGDFSKLSQIEAYWTNPQTIAVLKKFEAHLIVNLANEAGQDVSDSQFVSTYNRIIGKLRAAGVKVPFVVDAAGWGRNVEQLLRVAPQILGADPLHNVVFSWHEYDSGADQPARIDKAMANAKAQKIVLLIGEFGNVSPGACGQAVPYQHLIQQAQANGIGYLPWSWDNDNDDCGSSFDMVGDGIHFNTLKSGYAADVVLNNQASIAKTARLTAWQTTGKCGG